jgi:hypothetical protein
MPQASTAMVHNGTHASNASVFTRFKVLETTILILLVTLMPQAEDRFSLGCDYRILFRSDRDEMDDMGIRELYWANEWPTIGTLAIPKSAVPSELGERQMKICR